MSLPKEIWKAIPGYKGQYEASTLGRIRSVDWVQTVYRKDRPGTVYSRKRKGSLLKLSDDGKGYVSVSLQNKTIRVHNIIAKLFLGPVPPGKQINHIDGNKANSRLDNLEYLTPTENLLHAVRLGLKKGQRGEKSHLSKLTESQVRQIRKLHASGKHRQYAIAKRYAIDSSTVSCIIRRKLWNHLA